ncbi:MAG: DUF5683 domain-containing protein, partial [Fibrobacterota bacterium]|nr:DUF5683 domain-containing protein [Chitinispirillaceae bacterium]
GSVPLTDSVQSTFSRPLAGSLSLLLPGAGQFYTRQYFKGSIVTASEALTIGIALSWYDSYKTFDDSKKPLLLKADTSSGATRLKLLNDAEMTEFDARRAKYRMINALAWSGGIYVYGFLDAIGKATISDNSERNPLKAGLLSAVPGLGLGQWYNGSLSKAGMIFMGQMSMGVVSANYHRLMTKAEREQKKLDDLDTLDNKMFLEMKNSGYITKWENERQSAFNYRNTYLWFSIFYYLYGIFDAVVDAHLHDYPEKMKLYPDLVPSGQGVELRLNYAF